MQKPENFDELVSNSCLIAGNAAMQTHSTEARRTAAITEAVLTFVVQQGMVKITPSEEWPEWLPMQPQDWTT